MIHGSEGKKNSLGVLSNVLFISKMSLLPLRVLSIHWTGSEESVGDPFGPRLGSGDLGGSSDDKVSRG